MCLAAKTQIGQPHKPVVSHSPELPHVHIKFGATHPRHRDKQQASNAQQRSVVRKPHFINRKAVEYWNVYFKLHRPPDFLELVFVSWLIELIVKPHGDGTEHEFLTTCGSQSALGSHAQKTLENKGPTPGYCLNGRFGLVERITRAW